MRLSFHTLDVFTGHRFGGNPLAVVLEADGLSAEHMQRIAREFNLSETTFVMTPDDPANTAKVRIFFPRGEMPFAGHPVLGTAALLAELKQKAGCSFETTIKLELPAGLTPVRMSRIADRLFGVLTAPGIPVIADDVPPNLPDIARALNLEPDEIGFDAHHAVITRGGIGYLCVPLKTRDALARSRVLEPHWSALIGRYTKLDSAYLYVRGGDAAGTSFRARMFAPTAGIPEDPATGSATVQLAAQLLRAESLGDGTHRWQLEQGYEMGRPSDLSLEADVIGSKLSAVRVGGSAVRMMSGELET